MSAAMAGMPIAAVNKKNVIAFFIISSTHLLTVQVSDLILLPDLKVAPQPHFQKNAIPLFGFGLFY
jgi:hypothetical protein